MKDIQIFDEENTLVIDDEFSTDNFELFPEEKKIKVTSSIKDDVFYNKQVIEYKISNNPIELYMRTLESSHEPPLEYSIKDGVVLESEILKNSHFMTASRIENLKKEVEWRKVELPGNYELNTYILFKHPEIISNEDYRRFLRQSVERIKSGILKVEIAVKENTHGLEIYTSEDGKNVWYKPPTELESKEIDEYWNLPEEKRLTSKYGKKFKYAEEFNESLFLEDSLRYVGISEYEFKMSNRIVAYIEGLLENKDGILFQKEKLGDSEEKINQNKTYTYRIYFLTILFIFFKLIDFIDWSWFLVLSPVLIWEGLGFIRGFLNAFNERY